MEHHLPGADDEILEEAAARAAERKKERDRRIALGHDERIQVGDSPLPQGDDDLPVDDSPLPFNAPIEDYEARWGFSLPDLRAASKVVSILFAAPALFVGDPYLAESRLYTMISRDRKTKRENRDVYKQVMNEEKTRRDRSKRQHDIETIRKTTMKKEREEALNALLLPPRADDDDSAKPALAITDRPDVPMSTCSPTSSSGDDALRRRLLAAFENIIMLESEYNEGQSLVAADQQRACFFTTQIYRYLPHEFGTQMPAAIVPASDSSTSTKVEFALPTLVHLKQSVLSLAAVLPVAWEFPSGEISLARRIANIKQRGDPLLFAIHSALLGEPNTHQDSDHGSASCPSSSFLLDAAIACRVYIPQDFVRHNEASVTAIRSGEMRSPYNFIVDPPEGVTDGESRDAVVDDNTDAAIDARKFVASMVFSASTCGDAEVTGSGEPTDDSNLFMNRIQKCHTCKSKYQRLHRYYYSLCRPCAEYNYSKRHITRDLRGKVVLMTGCRIKIGYAMSLSLLRCGATFVGTTRFAHDAYARFMAEPDYANWKSRLHLFSLDLRDMWMVTQFCAFIMQRFPKLFAIINNAAQTIARTVEYTAQLRAQESAPPQRLKQALKDDLVGGATEWHQFFCHNSSVSVGHSLQLEYHPIDGEQPFEKKTESARSDGAENHIHSLAVSSPSRADGSVIATCVPLIYDRYDTQAEESDQREHNSWTLRMHQVEGSEAAEVMAINALSPFVLNSKLKPALLNRDGDRVSSNNKIESRFIINISAMEGQFYRYKQVTHPHTNMAKAALNMMTRTSAEDYAKDNIYMNSVDTGWITDESPQPKKQRRAEGLMMCPLDEVDAAARCLDLIYTNSTEYGKFWKDFHTIPW